MKHLFLLIILLAATSSCRHEPDYGRLFSRIEKQITDGTLSTAESLADSVKQISAGNDKILMTADSLKDLAHRIRLEYTLELKDVTSRLEKSGKSFTLDQLKEWESSGWLEGRVIDGKMMYFNRSVSNLFLIKSFHDGTEAVETEELTFRRKHVTDIVHESSASSRPVHPVSMNVTYTITVERDAVPAGEIIRCWLPWPAPGNPRQKNIKLLSASADNCVFSPDSSVHSTVFMEKPAEKGTATVFRISYSYDSYAQHFFPDSLGIKPYDRNSAIFREYTREELPHIRCSPEVMRLADSIASNSEDPPETVKRIYMWFKDNIPWAGALEYSVMPDIPGYVCTNRRGDCGMQTFLFMSMLRYKGIPVRWQSGWMVPPAGKNLHDWCEVYYEGTGWVPVDVSYSLQRSGDPAIREYYFSGIDSYRLIVNRGVAGKLYPQKKYFRSEPYDFQRGEVEWRGGNLYFDKWDYDMTVEYLNK